MLFAVRSKLPEVANSVGGYFGTESSFKHGPVVPLEASESARDRKRAASPTEPAASAALAAAMEQQAARLGEGPQSNAASRVEGRPAGQQKAVKSKLEGPNGWPESSCQKNV